MVSIRVNGEDLDLFPGTSLPYNGTNPLFLDGELDKIVDSFTFPITVPLSQHNRQLFDFPDQIDNTIPLADDLECEIYFNGFFLFEMTGYLSQATRTSVKLTMVSNVMTGVKDVYLSDLDLGGVVTGNQNATLSAALASATTPLSYNYAFFPIYNPGWFNAENAPASPSPSAIDVYQNYWDAVAGTFISDADNQAAMPFVRIDHILSKICTYLGYTIDNQWQTTDELKLLYIYNNFSIYEDDLWAGYFNLRNHVPPVKVADFFKAITRLFAIGPFPDKLTKTFELIPAKDLLTDAITHDWTYAADYDYEIETDPKYPSFLDFLPDANDKMSEENAWKSIEVDAELDNYSDLSSQSAGIYYVKSVNAYYDYDPGRTRTTIFLHKQFEKADLENDEGQPWQSPASPLYMERFQGQQAFYPKIHIEGRIKDYEQGQDPGIRLIFYRGLNEGGDGYDRPLATNNVYDFDDVKQWDHALLWNTEYGIHEKYWNAWMQFLKDRKVVKRKLYLKLADFINFRWKHKVKIGENHYFVNELKVNFPPYNADRIEVEAELSTVLI